MIEEYRPVVGYEDLYEVSNLGNVRSKSRTINKIRSNGRSYRQVTKPKQLTIYNDTHTNSGYSQVWLQVQPKPRNVSVHRLVAEAFIPNPNNLPVVNHKDGNKHNNCVDNLEWCTSSENRRHAIDTGLAVPNVENMLKVSREASKHPVRCVETGEEFDSCKAASLHFGVHDQHVDVMLREHDGYSRVLNLHFERI